jgi:hypothetical protein
MTSTYECKRCMFNTYHFNNIKRHINKKKICERKIGSYNYSDDQILILTLLPSLENNDEIKKEIEYLKKSNCIHKNKTKLLNEIEFIDKNKLKKCMYCNEEFNKIIDLRKHFLIHCFYKELQKNININLDNKKILIDGNNNLNNTTNNQCITNNNNITNIYLDYKKPIPFDGQWDISMIDQIYKERLIFSNFMYTKLLEEILKNEINLNVIIDKSNDSGIVYKNDIDKYIQMKSKDIIDNTMDKLKKHLLDFNNESEKFSLIDCIKLSKRTIEKKHENYVDNEKIKKDVKDIMSNIFEEKKEDAINISINMQDEMMQNIDKGF